MNKLLFSALIAFSLFACSHQTQLKNNEINTAMIHFITPSADTAKQILVVEGYSSLECPVKRNLNKSHENYLGVLLHHQSQRDAAVAKSIEVAVGKPITLAISLSQVHDKDNSNICYYQYHALTPTLAAEYEVRLTADCELFLFKTGQETDNSGLTFVPQNTEKEQCD